MAHPCVVVQAAHIEAIASIGTHFLVVTCLFMACIGSESDTLSWLQQPFYMWTGFEFVLTF